MSLNDARKFVDKMKDDHNFREKVMDTSSPEDLSLLLYAEGLKFDQRDLAGAMAECMARMEQQMKG